MRLFGRPTGHRTEPTLHDSEPQPLWSRFAHIGLLLLIILASLGITSTAAAFALNRSRIGLLETETASRLQADYSADSRDIRVAPLDPAIISVAADDERDLAAATSEAPQRVEVARQPTARPVLREPTPTLEPPDPPASDPLPSPSPTARPVFAAPGPTDTPTDTPSDTSTNTPTDTPSDTPTDTPANTPTDTLTNTPTDTPTQTPRTPTNTPADTPTDTPTATPFPPTPSMTATVAATNTPTPLPVPIVSIDPASQTTSDATVSIEVLVMDATDLGSYEVALTWDASLLTFISIDNEGFLGSTGRSVVCSAPSLDAAAATLDSIRFGCNTTGDSPGPSGRGILTALNFATVAAGRTELALAPVTLTDTAGLSVAPMTANGAITVVSPTATDTPPSTETLTATALPATPTASATATTAATATNTLTPIATGTATPTAIATPTATASATELPSATASATLTSTPLPTVTPSITATATPTFIATVTGTASPTITPTATPLPNVFVDPASQATSSDIVSIDIRVADIDALGNYVLTLTWDSAVLGFVSVTNAPFLGSTGRTVTCLPPSTTATSFTFGCSSTGGFAGPSGGGVIATVDFATVAGGGSSLALSAALSDTANSPIPATTTDGSVTFVATTATATSTETSTPTLTSTPTATATSTATSTPTLTSTPTATATSTATSTPTSTSTSTPTATSTATATPTSTSTPTPTATSTATATPTFTSTATPTATSTATSTPTSTLTAAITPTATIAPTVTPTLEPQAKVAVDPPSQAITAPEGSVDIKVSSVTDLGAYGFELTYDPAVVAFVSVTNGAFLGSTGRTITCVAPVLTGASVTIGCDSSGGLAGPVGSGTLATVVFGAVAEGTSDLQLTNILLNDTLGLAISRTTDDGQITINSPASTPVPTPTPTVTPTPTP